MSTVLPKEIYVWDESPENPRPNLNLNPDGGRPTPGEDTEGSMVRAGVYQLVREVDIIKDVKEVEIKPAVDLPSSLRHLK